MLLKVFRNGSLVQRKPTTATRTEIFRDTRPQAQSAGQQACAARSANGRSNVEVGQPQPSRCHLVEIRCEARCFIPVRPNVPVSPIWQKKQRRVSMGMRVASKAAWASSTARLRRIKRLMCAIALTISKKNDKVGFSVLGRDSHH